MPLANVQETSSRFLVLEKYREHWDEPVAAGRITTFLTNTEMQGTMAGTHPSMYNFRFRGKCCLRHPPYPLRGISLDGVLSACCSQLCECGAPADIAYLCATAVSTSRP